MRGVPANSTGFTESSCITDLNSCWEPLPTASVAPISCGGTRFRRRKNKKANATSTANPPMLAPAPIPAFAPVESPLVLGDVSELSADEVSVFALAVEVVEEGAVDVDEGSDDVNEAVDSFDLISNPGDDMWVPNTLNSSCSFGMKVKAYCLVFRRSSGGTETFHSNESAELSFLLTVAKNCQSVIFVIEYWRLHTCKVFKPR